MGLYHFSCLACEAMTEWTGSLADKPEELVCEDCGGRCLQNIAAPSVIIRKEQQSTTTEKMKKCIIDVAMQKSAIRKESEIAEDGRYVKAMRKAVDEERRSCSGKSGKPRIIGTLPAGYVQAQNLIHGKSHMNNMSRSELKKELKRADLWLGED